jgi:hypothetical protein
LAFARRAGNSRAARGVFWVFFTNARNTTTRRRPADGTGPLECCRVVD